MRNYILGLFKETAKKLDYLDELNLIFSVPQKKEHGDLSTNIAMQLTKKLKRNPREIAKEIIDNLSFDKEIIEKIDIAGPGFINFSFTHSFLSRVIGDVLNSKEEFGRNKKFVGQKAIVEFVSANPTGPLTVGHGRNAVIGDTVANMLEWLGYDVTREYYFNNAGRQMRVLGNSVRLRYLELLGENIDFPEDHYQGEYIIDIAKSLYKEKGDSLSQEDAEGIFKAKAESVIFDDIKNTLSSIGITFNSFYNENTLYESGRIDAVLKFFEDNNLSYKKEDATWLKLTELGNDQDKVIVKSTGEPTYRLPDIAYHITKFERGYDVIVDLFGSDHSATYPDVLAGIKAMGKDAEKVKVLIHQFVTILQDGEVVKMSTRKANFITLDELTNDVGGDVVRYFFIMRNMNTHLNFDLGLAKKQSDENPVFYLQYAHARICSILSLTKEEGLTLNIENVSLLSTVSEQNLLRKLHDFSYEIEMAALNYEPHKIANYLEDLAGLFHKFYTECRIIGSDNNIAEARIALITAVKQVLKNGLTILGVSAPERM